MAHLNLALMLVTFCWLTTPTATLPLAATTSYTCPEHAESRKTHCVCASGYTCDAGVNSHHCLVGQRSTDDHPISGFAQECTTCRCMANDSQQQPRVELGGKDSSPTSRGHEKAVEGKLQLEQRQQATDHVLIIGSVKPFAYLKLHKVGSTTVSIAFERLAEKHRLKLCGRGDSFWKTLPCTAWTTHDTEAVMAVQGAHGLRFMVGGGNAVIITLLRNPIDRLLSRYYYNLAMAGLKVTRPPSFSEFSAFLKESPAEPVHYVRALSGIAMSVEAAVAALAEFDVVGTSEELDGFMTLCSHHLNVPPAHLTYKNEKVVLGKPKFEDLEPELQALLRTVTADDHVVYMAAKAHFDDKRKQVADFASKLSEFQAAQAQVDQSCKFSETDSQVLTGKDCYQL